MSARRRNIAILIGLLWAVGLVGAWTPGPALAQAPGVLFQAGTVTADFPGSISWSFAFETDATITRVETLQSVPGSEQALVSSVPPESLGAGRYRVAGSSDAHVAPNSPLRLRLRVTTTQGVFVGPEAATTVSDERFAWRVRESEHIRLHWYRGDDAFAGRALELGERGITRAEELFGVSLARKVDFFVYADASAFRDAIGPGSPENAAGVAEPEIGTMFGLVEPSEIASSWVGVVIPHELTHLVYDVATHAPLEASPFWLNEGTAQYLSPGYTTADRARLQGAGERGELIPLDGLAGNFPLSQAGARSTLAYSEAASAVDFVVRTSGEAGVGTLVRGFGEGLTADEAFRRALAEDAAAFGRAWLADLGAPTPTRYGPQPAPLGPLPSDWQRPAQTLLPGSASPPGPETAAPTASPQPTGGADRDGQVAVAVALLLAGLALALALASLRRRRVA